MNHHVASTVTGHVAWPCVQSTFWFSITFLAAEPLEQMMEWARGNDNHFTWAALTSLSWVKSSALCSLQNNSVRGNAELITAIRWQSAAQQGLGWEPEVVFFFMSCFVCYSDSFWLAGKCSISMKAGVCLWTVCMWWWKRLTELL